MLYSLFMKIGELSKIAGVPIDTLRYYEKRGLIPQAVRSAYRDYMQHDATRLKFIMQAKELGFILEGIGQLLALRKGGRASVEVVKTVRQKTQIGAKNNVLLW